MSDGAPLSFTGVEFGYDRRRVLGGLDLELRPGEVTVLASPNGRGKTTALWLAAGLLRPQRGAVRVFGQDPFRQREVLGRVGFVPEGAPLPSAWTGAQVLAYQRATFPRWDEDATGALIQSMRLDLSARVSTLSRGDRGKLALAAALGTRPELLLLDEPTLGLDVATRRMVTRAVLGRLAEGGGSILLATHDIAVAERVGDRLIVLEEGRCACDEEILSLQERHRVLTWDRGPGPDAAWDPLTLPAAFGHRALARRWDEVGGGRWLAEGGRAEPADLETVYLALTGEVEYAW